MATIFKRYQDRVDKQIDADSGGPNNEGSAQATAPPKDPAAKPFDFFRQPPVDPEVQAARERQRVRALRNR